jgi:hypothetical protein
MRVAAALAACILVIPSYTTAQTTAADGVLALVRDDPAEAVRILRPLVEGGAEPDPLAAFFLALAYQSGGIGPTDQSRVCGLLLNAATPANPLRPQAQALAIHLHMNHALAREQCMMASARGWGEPAWTTFLLAPGHSVRIDRGGFFVEHQGSSKVTPEGWGGAGWKFLPIRLSEVELPGADRARRYFIDLFAWSPHTQVDAPQWSLVWFAYEVVGADVVRLSGNGLVVTTVGPTPPASFPVDEFARFVSTDSGQIERVIVGPEASRIRVPDRSIR